MSWWKRLVGGTSDGHSSRPVDFLAEALELESRGDYTNALTSYRLALRDHPDDLRVLQNMAIAFSRTAQPEEAIRSYRRALLIDNELAGAHYGLAFLLLKRGETTQATTHLEAFLRNKAGLDSASEKFRAHAEQTLQELQDQGGPSDADVSANVTDVHREHLLDISGPTAHVKRPDA